MSLGTSNRDGGKTSESGHLRALAKLVTGDVITGLNAVQRAAGVNMSVDVQVGDAFVRRSDGTYAHSIYNDAVYNQTITTADGSNPRRDIVVAYVDYAVTPITTVSNNTNGVVKIAVINGTPAGSPVDPTDPAIQSAVGAGNPWTKLCRVRVPAGQTSISNSLIDDLRSMTTANISNASVTTAKQTATTIYGSMNDLNPVTTTATTVFSQTLPVTTQAHKYLITAKFVFNHLAEVAKTRDYTGAIYLGGTLFDSSSETANPSDYVFNVPFMYPLVSSATGGQTIDFKVYRNVDSGGMFSGTSSRFTIVDLGCA